MRTLSIYTNLYISISPYLLDALVPNFFRGQNLLHSVFSIIPRVNSSLINSLGHADSIFSLGLNIPGEIKYSAVFLPLCFKFRVTCLPQAWM